MIVKCGYFGLDKVWVVGELGLLEWGERMENVGMGLRWWSFRRSDFRVYEYGTQSGLDECLILQSILPGCLLCC